jgi:hypothetical protein
MNQAAANTHDADRAKFSGIDWSCPTELSFAEALADPAGVFREPTVIVEHPWLTHEEKRTLLLSWARDEFALEQVASSALPELRPKSRTDQVIEALSRFDALAASEYRAALASLRGLSMGRKAQRTEGSIR